MKKKNLLIIILSLLFALASCSAPKKSNDVGDEAAAVDVSENDKVLDDLSEEKVAAEEGLENLEQEIMAAEENAPLAEEKMMEPEEVQEVVENKPEEEVLRDATENSKELTKKLSFVEGEHKYGAYTIKKGDTLMLVAFKLYGDYEKWKELLEINEGLSADKLKAGMQISYIDNGEVFEWNPQGNPYLIRWGDTLGLISGKVYGKKSKWRSIWDNNKPMIKDPNKIYAGFTLYYLDEDRGVASK